MSMLNKMTSMFSTKSRKGDGEASAKRGPLTKGPVDVESGGANGSAMRSFMNPKNKQEVIAELHRNYVEVLELVRKLGDHVDRQERRSARMMEIMEHVPGALEPSPELVAQNERIIESLGCIGTQQEDALQRVVESVGLMRVTGERQLESAQQVAATLERAQEQESGVTQAVEKMESAAGEMGSATGRLGESVDAMHRSTTRHEQELIRLVEANRKSMLTAIMICGGVAVVAIVIAIVAVTR